MPVEIPPSPPSAPPTLDEADIDTEPEASPPTKGPNRVWSIVLYVVAVAALAAGVVLAAMPFSAHIQNSVGPGPALEQVASCSRPITQVLQSPSTGEATQSTRTVGDGQVVTIDVPDLQPVCSELGRWRAITALMLVLTALLVAIIGSSLLPGNRPADEDLGGDDEEDEDADDVEVEPGPADQAGPAPA